VLSHAPAGIGVFDATLLFAVGGSPSAVAAALLTYRVIISAHRSRSPPR
jgi:uncharacterized membrane protein YbhN (UPF0104 family)